MPEALYTQEDALAVSEAIRAGAVGAYSENVGDFEVAIADRTGYYEAVATSSGTSALIVGLRAIGIGPGSTVALPSLTFVATAQAVRATGADCVFVDVDPETLHIDPEQVGQLACEQSLHALIAVDLFGLACNTERLAQSLARADAPVALVRDAAQSFGSIAASPRPETFAAYSFNRSKQLPLGQGGAVCSDHQLVIEHSRRLRHSGLQLRDGLWLTDEASENHLPNGLAASLGLSVLRRFDELASVRRSWANALDALAREHGLVTAAVGSGGSSLPYLWMVRFPDGKRNVVLREASRRGIDLIRYQPPAHLHPAFMGVSAPFGLGRTERFWDDHLVLAPSSGSSDQQLEQIERLLGDVL